MASNAVKSPTDIFPADQRASAAAGFTFNVVRNPSGNVTPNNVSQLVGFSLDFDTVEPNDIEAIKTELTNLVTVAPTYIGVCDGFVQMGYFFKRPFEKSPATTNLIRAYTEALAETMCAKGFPAQNQNTAVDRIVQHGMVITAYSDARMSAPDTKFIEARKEAKAKAKLQTQAKQQATPQPPTSFRGDVITLDGLSFMKDIGKYRGFTDGEHTCECLLNPAHIAILNPNGEAGLYCEQCFAGQDEAVYETPLAFFARAITESGNMQVAEEYCQLYRSTIVRGAMSDILPSNSPKVIADAFMKETPYVKTGLIFVQTVFRRYNGVTRVWELLSEARINEDIRRYDGQDFMKGDKTDVLKLGSAMLADVRVAIAERLATSGDNASIIRNVEVPVPGQLFSNGFLTAEGKLITDEDTIKSFGCTETQYFDTPWIDAKDAPSFEEECPMLDAYFKKVLNPDYLLEYDVAGPDPRSAAIKEIVGLALLGLGTKAKKILCLIGPPGYGKSTFIEMLSSLFPQGLVCTIQPHNFDTAFALTNLIGARINLVDDVKKAAIKEDGALKAAITGGPIDEVTRKYLAPVPNYRPIAAHIWGSNNRINVQGGSTGLAARMLEIDFTVGNIRDSAEKIDDYSGKTVAAERYAIVRHFIYAALDCLMNRGMQLTAQPDAAEKFKELAAPTSPAESFFGTLVFDENARLTSNVVYDAFKAFCEANGFKFASTKPSFDKLFGNWRRINNKRDWTHKNSAGNIVFRLSLDGAAAEPVEKEGQLISFVGRKSGEARA